MESFGDNLLITLEGETQEVSVATLQGKTVGLYFSAHWCPPCRAFTPQLKKVYEAVRKVHKDFEIIFVSRDRDPTSFKEYFAQMPWMAVPFEAAAVRDRLCSQHSVSSIPTLVILGPDGKVIAKNAKSAVAKDPTGQHYPWEGSGEDAGSFSFLFVALVVLLLLQYFKVPEMLGIKFEGLQ